MRIISLFLLLWCALIADEWRDVLGTVDAQQIALDGDAAKVTAVEVINVTENSAAQAMGLRIGDHILAYDGLRCFGEGERNLIRYRYQPLSDTLRITVLRGGKIIELETRDIKPVKIIGFVAQVNDRAAYRAALESAGFPSMDTKVCDVADFPRRAGCALLRWKTKAPQQIEPDNAWINRLAICFQALVEQQWAKAEKMAIGVPDSCPELQRLERFYHALAAYHAGGERAPDPNHYGEPLLYDVIHYPYPHLKLPEIGNFTHTDSVFMDMLKKKQSDPVNYSDIEPIDIGVRQSLSNRSYSSFVLLSLFHYQYGGWPYRSDSVYQSDSRHQLVAQLNSEIVSGSPNATWSRFCLVFPTFLNARFDDFPEEKRAQEREAAITLLEKVRKEAPLLGHLGYVILELAHSYYELSEYRDSLRAHLESGPMIAAAKPSLLLDYLRAHEASLVFHLFNEETTPSLSLNLHYVHSALGRQLPLTELRRRLAADGVDRLPSDQRLELMALARDYFHLMSPRVETSPFRAAFADNRIIDFCLKITIILS